MNRRTLWMGIFAFALVTMITGCSSSKPPITVAVTAPASVEVSDPVSISATVTNDKADAGVTWSCSTSPCGTFSSTTSASGASVTYLAPNTAGTVTLTATSVTNSLITGTASITITPIAATSSISGNYVFLINGWTTNGPFGAAGGFSADGNGNITAGEEDYADTTGTDIDDTFTGTYTIGSDGRGTITVQLTNGVTTGSSAIGVSGQETFAFAVTSSSHAVIEGFDGSSVGTGTLDTQATPPSDTTDISGAYSFSFAGADLISTVLQPGGGVLTADGSGNFATETVDYNDGGTVYTDTPTGDTYSTVDAMGRGTMSIDGDAMAFYYVGPEVVRFVDVTGSFLENGSLYGQGTLSPSNASLTGSYVFGEDGIDNDTSGELGLAGDFTADGSGNLTAGVADINDGSGTIQSAVPLTLTLSYSISSSGGGRGTFTVPVLGSLGDVSSFNVYLVDPALNIFDPNNSSGGGGALLFDADSPVEAVGELLPQAAPSSSTFQGNYAFSVEYVDDFTSTGQFLSDSVSALTGTADGENLGSPEPALTLTGSWALDGTNAGRVTNAFTFGFTPAQTYNYAQYIASSTVQLGVDITATDPGSLVIIEHQ
jgi:hypothetical protein